MNKCHVCGHDWDCDPTNPDEPGRLAVHGEGGKTLLLCSNCAYDLLVWACAEKAKQDSNKEEAGE